MTQFRMMDTKEEAPVRQLLTMLSLEKLINWKLSFIRTAYRVWNSLPDMLFELLHQPAKSFQICVHRLSSVKKYPGLAPNFSTKKK